MPFEPTESEMRDVVNSYVTPFIEDYKKRVALGCPVDEELILLTFRCFTSGCKYISKSIHDGIRRGM